MNSKTSQKNNVKLAFEKMTIPSSEERSMQRILTFKKGKTKIAGPIIVTTREYSVPATLKDREKPIFFYAK